MSDDESRGGPPATLLATLLSAAPRAREAVNEEEEVLLPLEGWESAQTRYAPAALGAEGSRAAAGAKKHGLYVARWNPDVKVWHLVDAAQPQAVAKPPSAVCAPAAMRAPAKDPVFLNAPHPGAISEHRGTTAWHCLRDEDDWRATSSDDEARTVDRAEADYRACALEAPDVAPAEGLERRRRRPRGGFSLAGAKADGESKGDDSDDASDAKEVRRRSHPSAAESKVSRRHDHRSGAK